MNFHRKYLLIFSIALCAGLLIHLLLFWINLGIPMEQERYIQEWLAKKDAYASSIEGRKLLFISGSNSLFGVDTRRIEQELGIPAVNFSTNATMRYYTFKRAQKHLHPGDIVILPLEYPYYTWHHDRFETEQALYLLGYDPSEIQSLPPYDQMKLISQISTRDLVKITWQRIMPPARVEGEYSSQYLNTNGDMTNNSKDKKLPNSALQSKINPKVFTEPPLTADAQQELESFISYCHEKNITVYAAWPNYLWREKSFAGEDLAGIHAIESFYQSHHVEIIGSYTDCLYDSDMFYDTNYHLNEEGKRLHTDYLIRLLRNKINLSQGEP